MKTDINTLRNEVSGYFYEILKDNLLDMALSKEEYEIKNREKIELQIALKDCIFQDNAAKQIVKKHIQRFIIEQYKVNAHNIHNLMDFDGNLDVEEKFNILLYTYKQKYGKDAFKVLIDRYALDQLKKKNEEEYYVITSAEIEEIYEKECLTLDFTDRLNLIVQNIYSKYKGFGVIDEILEMNVDGISGGVNGYPETFEREGDQIVCAYDSVWLFYKGKSIHLAFLSFKSYDELKRICQNIYKFDNPGELSRNIGYKINKLKDGSRVVVIRPDFSETWMFFIRKFHIKNVRLEDLIGLENKQVLIDLLQYIMKGAQNIAITGSQGCGKTTMLLALIEYVYAVYPLRICESSFELNLRKRFPNRNICSLQEIEGIECQEALDVTKKTDGMVTIIGEVASHEMASKMIQVGQLASKFTLFTHHANSLRELVMALRNSLLITGAFKNEKVAEEQVVSVLDFNLHLEKDFYGNRYIERVTECIPILSVEKTYDEVDIIVRQDGGYIVKNKISDHRIRVMKKEMKNEDKVKFEEYLKEIRV